MRPRGRTTRPVRGTMNKLEARYAAFLALQKRGNLLADYWFEAFKLRLANKTWYTPDFLVQRPDGTLEIHETKGFMQEDANVKLKITADLYWQFPVFLVTERRGHWIVTRIGA